MKNDYIITIARQYGCGGRAVGRKLSEALAIKYYDSELLSRAAAMNGVDEKFYRELDEKARSKFSSLFSYSNAGGSYFMPVYSDLVANDQLFYTQANIVKEVSEEPCVIVGRCADYVLRERPNLVRVYLHASVEARKDRIINNYGIEEGNVEKTIAKADKRRSIYYNTYTDQDWGDARNYDLTLDTSKVSIDDIVELIIDFIECIDKKKKQIAIKED